MAEFDLLNKTELRIEQILLQGANLNQVADVVADVFELSRGEVLVTDALNDVLVIDILRQTVNPYQLVGKKSVLFERLAGLPGIGITDKTSICSEGMMGWMTLDETRARLALKRSEMMAEEIRRRVGKRALVFSTGFEVSSGQIVDTNKPTIARRLERAGYSVTLGADLKDDRDHIHDHLRRAVEDEGYGLVITTGGVGAEAKDRTIEALLKLDPEAATPYVCKFEPGTGRHEKDGVRIGVGRASGALIVALTGPNDEVKRSLEVLVRGLESELFKNELAEEIARNLRAMLRERMKWHVENINKSRGRC